MKLSLNDSSGFNDYHEKYLNKQERIERHRERRKKRKLEKKERKEEQIEANSFMTELKKL